MLADLNVLRGQHGKCPLRTGCVTSLQSGGVHQCLDLGPLAAGFEWQQDRPGSGAGETDRNNKPFHKVIGGQFILKMLRAEKGIRSPCTPSRIALSRRDKAICVHSRQTGRSERENSHGEPPNARIGRLNLSEVLDDGECFLDHL